MSRVIAFPQPLTNGDLECLLAGYKVAAADNDLESRQMRVALLASHVPRLVEEIRRLRRHQTGLPGYD